MRKKGCLSRKKKGKQVQTNKSSKSSEVSDDLVLHDSNQNFIIAVPLFTVDATPDGSQWSIESHTQNDPLKYDEPKPGCSFWPDQPTVLPSCQSTKNMDVQPSIFEENKSYEENYEPIPGCSFWSNHPCCIPLAPTNALMIDRHPPACPQITHSLQQNKKSVPAQRKVSANTHLIEQHNDSTQRKKQTDRNRYHSDINYCAEKKRTMHLKYLLSSKFREKQKARSKEKYSTQKFWRDSLKIKSKQKYATQTQWKERVKSQSKRKYASNEGWKERVKLQSKDKYATHAGWKERVKSKSKVKYATDEGWKERHKLQSKDKYATDEGWKERLKLQTKDKYATDEGWKERLKLQSKEKYATDEGWKERLKLQSKDKYATDEGWKERHKLQSKDKYATDEGWKEKVKSQSKYKYATDEGWREQVKSQSTEKYATQDDWRRTVKLRSYSKYVLEAAWREQVKQASRDRYRLNKNLKARLMAKNKQRYQTNTNYRKKINHACRVHYRMNRLRIIHGVRTRRVQATVNVDNVVDEFRRETSVGPEFICCVCHKLLFQKQVVQFALTRYEKKSENSRLMAGACASFTYLHECAASCMENCSIRNGPRGKRWVCHTCDRKLLLGEKPAEAVENGLELAPIPQCLQDLNVLERQLISRHLPFVKMVALPKGGQHGVIGPVVSVPSNISQTLNVMPRQDSDELIRVKLKRKLSFKGYVQYQYIAVDKLKTALEHLKGHNQHYGNVTIATESFDNPVPPFETTQLQNEEDTQEGPTENEEGTDIEGIQHDTCLQPIDIVQEVLDNTMERVYCVAPAEGNLPVRIMQDNYNEAMSFPVQFPDGHSTFNDTRENRITLHRYFLSRLMNADTRFSSDMTYLFYAQYMNELQQVISQVSIALRKGTRQHNVEETVTADNFTNPNFLRSILKQDKAYKFMKPIRGTPPYWQATLKDLFAMLRQLGKPTWFCSFSSAEFRWPEIIQTILQQQGSSADVNDLTWAEKCDLLKNAPVTTARMFDHRFKTFLSKVLLSDVEPIGKITDYFYRVEFQQRGSPHVHCFFWVQDAPQINVDSDQDVKEFVNRYVHCHLPDEETYPVMHEIVASVQQHSKRHSKTCKQRGDECRFNFPRPPSCETFICRPQTDFENLPGLSAEENLITARNVLRNVKEVLTEREYSTSEEVLDAAGITQQAFQDASCILSKRTSTVLERKPTDIWINNYNSTLLHCWNANMDIQFITDAYSCMMYVISYISKAETEAGAVLEKANKEAAEGNLDAQGAMKKIGGVYFNHREIGAQEAAYRVCELHLKESSRKVQFIPVGRNPVRMSLPLSVIRSRHAESEDVWLSSLIDKYRARPDTDEFSTMCLAVFCSDYRLLSRSELNNTNRQHVATLAGDLGYVLKRTRTDSAIIRYPRFTADKQPEDYFISQLQLFLPHRTDDDLKPMPYASYEDYFFNGAVELRPSLTPTAVKDVVLRNSMPFNKLDENYEDNFELQFAPGFEQAWATLCPESEAERLECVASRIPDDRDPDELTIDNIPELMNNPSTESDQTIEILQPLFTKQDILPLLRSLNNKQRSVFYSVRQYCLEKRQGKRLNPFYMFLTGGAGVGKSHLVKCIFYEAQRILAPAMPTPDTISILMCAPTGTAAFNIGGATIHSAFGIGRCSKGFPPLGEAKINALRSKLANIEILIIDEISMVSKHLLKYIHYRLRQIKQRIDNAPFGNVCVIAVGDFYQLPPVCATSLSKSTLTDYFDLWKDNFQIVELTEVMRQKDDATFARFLNRIRVKSKSDRLCEEDLDIIHKSEKQNLPEECLHIFPTNKQCNVHNKEMLRKVCTDVIEIAAETFSRNPCTGRLSAESPSVGSSDSLPETLAVAINARVMLIRNLNTGDGLVNGVLGTVKRIVQNQSGKVSAIFVKFDDPKVGKQVLRKQTYKEAVLVERFSEQSKGNHVLRQFPLKLAWACTAHKVQGITTDMAVVSLRNVFAPAGSYVALSRVTSLQGLKIIDFKEQNLHCPPYVADSLQAMEPFPLTFSTEETSHTPGAISLALLNIQGLFPHVDDLMNHSSICACDVIALTETWLDDEYGPFIPEFNSYFQTRAASYDDDEEVFQRLKHEARGGVGTYCKHEMNLKRMFLAVSNLEYIAMANQAESLIVVTVYRTQSYPATLFARQLRVLLTDLESKEFSSIIIVGDFNENLFSVPTPIFDLVETFGYRQIVTQSTTIWGSLLDHVYVKARMPTPPISVIPTYYSDHVAIRFQIIPE